jgi:very-short-patch-repair endonuclease
MHRRGEILITIMNNALDFNLAHEQHWYRIPVVSANKWIKDAWPPDILAFYQTKVFGTEAFAVNYFAEVDHIQEVRRRELFPDQPEDKKSNQLYYKIFLKPLQRLIKPIISQRRRRIIFISSTMDRFTSAVEINDLYQGSSLEECLWKELKKLSILAEREEYVEIKQLKLFLDFAIYCANGHIDIETDGDLWHANPEKASEDNYRNNALETIGWKVIRFNNKQIQEEMSSYCVPTIVDNINRLGGIEEGKTVPRKIGPPGLYQPTLFDDFN